MRIAKAAKELKKTREKPQINAVSRTMSKKASQDAPLLERFSKMLDRKQQRMLKLEHDVLERKMIEDPDAFNPPFRPKINEVSCRIVDEKRRARDMTFIESLNVWK